MFKLGPGPPFAALLKLFVDGEGLEKAWGETVLSLVEGPELLLAFPMILEGDTEG